MRISESHLCEGRSSHKSWKPFLFVVIVTFIPPGILALDYLAGSGLRNPSYILYLLSLAIYVWVVTNVTIPYFCSPLRNLPSPPGVSFLFGHGYPVLAQPPGVELLRMALSVPNDGVYHFRGPFHTMSRLVPTSPEAFAEILSHRSYDYVRPAPARSFLRLLVGEGLVVAEGELHKKQRKSVTPAFHGKNVRELVPLFWEKSKLLVKCLGEQLSRNKQGKLEGILELDQWSSRATLDIIGVAAANRDFDSLHNAADPLAILYDSLTNPNKGNVVRYFVANMILPPWLLRWLPWKTRKLLEAVSVELRRVARDLITDSHEEVANEDHRATYGGKPRRKDILSILIRSNDQYDFTDDELVDQTLTFLAAGHDTTAHALSWAAYLLATHPDVQEKLRAEVLATLPPAADPAAVDASRVDSMPYLQAVTSEVLRLYPSVPLIPRETVRETVLLGTVVPKGTPVVPSAWLINRHPQHWGADAAEFKPERWMASVAGDGGAQRPLYGGAASASAFATFIQGPRACVGQAFARLELKCLVAALVGAFALEMRDPGAVVEPAGALTIKPKGGLWLKLKQV